MKRLLPLRLLMLLASLLCFSGCATFKATHDPHTSAGQRQIATDTLFAIETGVRAAHAFGVDYLTADQMAQVDAFVAEERGVIAENPNAALRLLYEGVERFLAYLPAGDTLVDFFLWAGPYLEQYLPKTLL